MPSKNLPNALQYRATTLTLDSATGGPASLNETERSVESIIATEAPIRSYEYRFDGYYDEMLLMSGVVIPPSGQVPLLDTHSKWDTAELMGSTRSIRVEGDKLIGKDIFSTVDKADKAWIKTKEGHLTARSAGFKYYASDAVKVDAGQTAIVNGRSFTAGDVPLVIVKKWELKENSLCVIGKDDTTNTRAQTPGDAGPNKENESMKPELLALLRERGLKTDATAAEIETFVKNLPAAGTVPGAGIVPGARAEDGAPEGVIVDPAGVVVTSRAAGADAPIDASEVAVIAIRAERTRVTEIGNMCRSFGITAEDQAKLVDDGSTVDAARAFVMDAMQKVDTGSENVGFRTAIVGEAEGTKFMAAAGDALAMRAGMGVEKPADGATDLRGYSLIEMARACMRYDGQRDMGDPMKMIGRALTTTDLPLLLANVANKSLMSNFATQPHTWREWCGTGSVSDFKTYTEVGVSNGGLLKPIEERGEYEFDKLEEESISYSIATLGKMFRFSRQMLINDDLNALSKIGRIAGESAQRTLNMLAYAVLRANGVMTDGVAIFHANHKNIATSGIIGTTTIDNGKRLMQLQRGVDGEEKLNLKPEYILAPTGAETEAEDFFQNTVYDASDKASTRKNRYNGTNLKRIYDAELDGPNDTDKIWYMAGAKGNTVNMNFLNGNEQPFLDSREGWNQDGIEWKIRLDCGASVSSYKTLVRNAGV